MKIKFDYDSENDILYFYSEEKKVDFSVDYDDTILDISGNKITGVEIMDASEKFAKDEGDIKRIKEVLKSIKEVYMGVKYGMLIQVPIKKEMIIGV